MKSANIYVYQEGNGWPVEQQLNFNARPDAKGNFAIDDMPPGNYFLNVWIAGNRPFQMQAHRFTVPKVHEKLSQRPVDLGVLTMEAVKNQ